MGEEDINTYKKYISNLDITKYIIKDDEDNYWYSDKYVYQLQTQLQQKENIIKEVREKVNRYPEFNYSNDYMIFRNEIKEILDKVD